MRHTPSICAALTALALLRPSTIPAQETSPCPVTVECRADATCACDDSGRLATERRCPDDSCEFPLDIRYFYAEGETPTGWEHRFRDWSDDEYRYDVTERYDGEGRIVERLREGDEQLQQIFTYDEQGQLIAETNGFVDHVIDRYEYTYADGCLIQELTYDFDEAEYPTQTEHHVCDNQGRRVETSIANNPYPPHLALRFELNAEGHRTGVWRDRGATGSYEEHCVYDPPCEGPGRVCERVCSPVNQVSAFSACDCSAPRCSEQGSTCTCFCNGDGQIQRMDLDHEGNPSIDMVWLYFYDGEHMSRSMFDAEADGRYDIVDWYTRDERGRVILEVQQGGIGGATQFEYDEADRVVMSHWTGEQSGVVIVRRFEYDERGNRILQTMDTGDDGLIDQRRSWTYDTQDRLAGEEFEQRGESAHRYRLVRYQFAYDDAGNRTHYLQDGDGTSRDRAADGTFDRRCELEACAPPYEGCAERCTRIE